VKIPEGYEEEEEGGRGEEEEKVGGRGSHVVYQVVQ